MCVCVCVWVCVCEESFLLVKLKIPFDKQL